MIPMQHDIASKLLHSSDARIAEAAKRVFSSTLPAAAAASLAALSAAPSLAFTPDAFSESPFHASVDQSDHDVPSTEIYPHRGDEHTANFSADAVESTETNDEVPEENEGSDKKPSSTERLKRSRERNRMHARKTRQRKKEHMQKLQNRADELKLEQIRIKQAINEKNTASILVGLFQNGEDDTENGGASVVDPEVEALLKRSTEDIPDASTIPELPALILPGQHNGKRKSSDCEGDHVERESLFNSLEDLQEDGIDYALLGKDRSACSPSELDQIRRERNRMHAKRTRDRKRIFMEEMEVMIKQLEDDNALLQAHANKLNANQPPTEDGASIQFSQAVTPELSSQATVSQNNSCGGSDDLPQPKGDFLNQIESLLAAAGSFQKKSVQCEINAISCAESDVTASTNHSDNNGFGEEEDDQSHELAGSQTIKRQRVSSDLPTSVPTSITTTNYSL